MSCEHYWREGIVLVEHGEPDPHRDSCADCQRAHASRQELIEALPLVGGESRGDPRWQANVWRRIDREVSPARSSWRWQLAGALTAACAVLLWLSVGRWPSDPDEPQYEIVPRSVAMRSNSKAFVGDELRVHVDEKSSVWIYRTGDLVRECAARQTANGCSSDSYHMIASWLLTAPVLYQVLVVESVAASSSHNFDKDLSTLDAANIHYKVHLVQVR